MPWADQKCPFCGGPIDAGLFKVYCPECEDEEVTKPDIPSPIKTLGLDLDGRIVYNGIPDYTLAPPSPGDLCPHDVLYRSLEGVTYCWRCGGRC